MGIQAKHMATFILGAAAGFAAAKYSSMTPEEREAMMEKLKSKASDLKKEAESSADKAKEYFEELQSKGTDELKKFMTEAEKLMKDLFNTRPAT